jgi:hypothetical protein
VHLTSTAGRAAAYGVMASVMGVGAVVGGLISAARPRPRARALCLAAIGWGIAILAAAAAPTMRGRVMALWALAWLGSTPIGGPIVGFVGQDVGAWFLVVGGLPTLLCGILALPALARIDRRGPDSPDRNALKSVTTGELLMPGRP